MASSAMADPPALSLPIDCHLGKTCYIEDYMDADPGAGQLDYTCGLKTRDGHRGTDFVLLTFEALAAGVDVLASAPGTVAATRDGVPDRPVTDDTRGQVKGRECGNAVRIDHGAGWQTLYCHLAQGSIMVRQGDRIAAGDPLGQVGLSGLTNIPHVHLTVLKNGQAVDPFHPDPAQSCGNDPGKDLWQITPDYTRAGLFTAGFSTSMPSFQDAHSGAARVRKAPHNLPIVLYAYAFHPKAGDTLVLSATSPKNEEIFSKTIEIEDPKAHLFRAFGRRAPAEGWPAGSYRGYVTMKRGDQVLAVRHADLEITP